MSLVSPAMVGRREELEALEAALGRTVAGAQETFLVAGEAGVGKSRLVAELLERAGSADATALRAGCIELEGGGIPFGPLVPAEPAVRDAAQTLELFRGVLARLASRRP
jgi:predicted ATPase